MELTERRKVEVGGCGDGMESVAANVGPKGLKSSVEMFEYFLKLLCSWSPDLDINKYEYMVLLDLLKKGHPDPAKKIGAGIEAFQLPKCVDTILPMPDHLKAQSTSDNVSGKLHVWAYGHVHGFLLRIASSGMFVVVFESYKQRYQINVLQSRMYISDAAMVKPDFSWAAGCSSW
ncbi:hypothetical protein OPV22_021125 [Ensete ventricosum]|uniref:Uncharacterized protein n=1 Tax=Ensete ventricosum TaxID=4639 RepID=A0AAV8QLQ8_ENSVE|nr:hypothetical protein OPV22_021125 [Ensete ventricosum]